MPATDQQRLTEGVANAIWAWAAIDNAMIINFAQATRMQNSLASAVYFSISNSEGRYRAVDAAVKEMVAIWPAGEPVIPLWMRVFAATQKLKGTRNKIAHGQLLHVSINGKTIPRITPPYQNTNLHRDMSKGLVGLGASEIENHVSLVYGRVRMLDQFTNVFHTIWMQPETLPDKFRQLADNLKTLGLPELAQTPPASQDPPGSSPP